MTKVEAYKRRRRLGMWCRLVDKRLADLKRMADGDLSKAHKFGACGWCTIVNTHCQRCPAFNVKACRNCSYGDLFVSRCDQIDARVEHRDAPSTRTARALQKAAAAHYKNLKRITDAWFANERKELGL